MALSVVLNNAQRRIDTERVAVTAAGLDFNGGIYSNTWIDPVTYTAMLRPAPLFAAWHTTGTGIYSRLTLSDFGLTTGWSTKGDKTAGQTRLFKPDGMGASSAISTSTYGENRGFFASFFAFTVGNDARAVYFECGWGNSGVYTSGVSLRVYASGVVEIWKDGAFLADYSLGLVGGQQLANKYNDLILLPMRRRELLVLNLTTGDGFTHVFTDIDETDTSPTITPDEAFWFYVPNNSTVDVEIAPLQFQTSGYLNTNIYSFGTIPQTGQILETFTNAAPAAGVTNAKIYGDEPFAGTSAISAVTVKQVDGTTNFTPNGVLSQCRVRVDFTSSGTHTSFLYGLHLAYAGSFVNTDDSEEFDITSFITEATLDVPDDPGGVRFSMRINQPQLLAQDVPDILSGENIPAKVMLGTNVLLDGVTLPLKFEVAVDDEAQFADLTIVDRTYGLQRYSIRDRIPLDGFQLSHATTFSAVRFLGAFTGANRFNLDTITYNLGAIPPKQCGEFNFTVSVGSNPFQEIQNLATSVGAGTVWGIKPGYITGETAGVDPYQPVLFWRDPANFSATPDYTLYPTEVDALAAMADATDLYYEYREEPLELEANEVRAVGLDPRKNMPITAYKKDTASQDPTTAPSLRPTNWVGEPRVIAYSDPRFTSVDTLTRVVDSVYDIVTTRRILSEFGSKMLFKTTAEPVWRGDLVRIKDIYVGGSTDRDVRINSMRVEFVAEHSGVTVRQATYTGGAILGIGGTGLDQIKNRYRMKTARTSIERLITGAESIRTGFFTVNTAV